MSQRRETYNEFQAAASNSILQAQYLRTLIEVASTNQLTTTAVIALRVGEGWLKQHLWWPRGMRAVIASAVNHGFASEEVRIDHAHMDLRETFKHLQILIASNRALRTTGREGPIATGTDVINRIGAMYGSLGEIGPVYRRLPMLDARWKAQRAAFQQAAEEGWDALDAYGSAVEHDLSRHWPSMRRQRSAAI
jgi:hypothetical protein